MRPNKLSVEQKRIAIEASPLALAMVASNFLYKAPQHLQFLSDKLRDVESGKIKRLIVSMPPRHGKSEMISKYFPVWWLLKHPEHRIMLTSYQSTFASSWSRKSRDIFEYVGKNYFGYKLAFGAKRNDQWNIEGFEGGIDATGIGGGQTGKGANLLIIDDPVKNFDEAFSQTYREKNWDWFQSTALTRLEPNGAVIIIMTRWHYDDLVGRILKENKGEWDVVNFPALATENDVLGREVGEALWADRYSKETLELFKVERGSYVFSSLYQQTPQDSEHQIYRMEWWQYYNSLPNLNYVVQSWDTAFKDKEKNDYSVCMTGGVSDTDNYLIDMFRKKLEFPELLRMVVALAEKYNPHQILIEDKASGQSLIQSLKRETRLPIKAVPATSDKVTRAHLVTPMIEAKKVYLPDKASWVADFLSETSEFPFSAHDDIVDSVNQLLSELRKSQSSIKVYNPANQIIKKNYFGRKM